MIERQALRPLAQPIRRLLVTPAIGELLDGKHAQTGFPDGFADADVAKFLAGWLVVVSLTGKPVRRNEPTLERLEGLDEVWAFCIRRPRPGWRIFGRFLDRDVFIGLRAFDRHELNGRRTYAAKAREAAGDWPNFLGPGEPLRAAKIDDYLSGVFRDADEKI